MYLTARRLYQIKAMKGHISKDQKYREKYLMKRKKYHQKD